MKFKPILLIIALFASVQSNGQILKDLAKVKDKMTSVSLDKLSKDPITTSFKHVDKKRIEPETLGLDATYLNLHDQPFDPTTGFSLQPGYYEANVQSFCIKAGTYLPTKGSGRFYAELRGPKADIFESILMTLHTDRDVKQRDVQLLLWAIIAKTDFQKMKGPIKVTALKILTPEQIARLSKGALENIGRKKLNKLAYKNDAIKAVIEAENNLRSKFYSGVSDYAQYEEIAMLAGVEPVVTGYEVGKWSYHPDGYYIRYYPSRYSKTKQQIYVPESTGAVIYNALGDIAVPASTGSQRLLQTNIPYSDPDWRFGSVNEREDDDVIYCVQKIDPLVDQAIQEQLLMQNLPGIVAAVFQNGEIVHMKAYGFNNIYEKRKLSIETILHWASISKTITSTAALQMQEDPNIDFDIGDRVTKFLPSDYWSPSVSYTSRQGNTGTDSRPGRIQLDHLLQNRSGVNWYGKIKRKKWTIIKSDTVDFVRSDNPYSPENDQFNGRSSVEKFNNSVLGFEPGSDYNYTTYGFNLIGAVIDETSSDGYVKWVRDHIARPSKMKSIRVANVRKPSGLVNPYDDPIHGQGMSTDGVLKLIKTTDKESVLPGGGWESNICDLAKFALGLAKGDYHNDDDILWDVNNGQDYKYGVYLAGSGTDLRVYHGGKHNNLRSFMHFFPSDSTGIVLITPAVYADLSQLARIVYKAKSIRPNLYNKPENSQTPRDLCRADMNSGDDLFNLVWRKTNKDVLIRTGIENDAFIEEVQRLRNAGYQVKDIQTFQEGDKRYWDGIFQKGHPRTKIWRNSNKSAFVAKCKEMKDDGYRLMDVETYSNSGTQLWAGVFRKTDDGYSVRLDRSTGEFAEVRENEHEAGKKLIDIEVYTKNGALQWNGVFTEGESNLLNRNMTRAEFGALNEKRKNSGYKLLDLEYYKVNDDWRIAAIWEKSNDQMVSKALWEFCSSMSNHESLSADGYELIDWDRIAN